MGHKLEFVEWNKWFAWVKFLREEKKEKKKKLDMFGLLRGEDFLSFLVEANI
jgi:hypothetical protein